MSWRTISLFVIALLLFGCSSTDVMDASLRSSCETDLECHAMDHARGITDHGNAYYGHPGGR